jgi:perosamine synthetase
MINSFLCSDKESLLGTMKVINKNTKGICFLVSTSNTLVGVVTDGDIRRAILSGFDLQAKIIEIVDKNFIFGFQSDSVEKLISKCNDKIQIIPLLDDKKRVIDYFEYTQSVHFPIANPSFNGNEFKYLTDAFFSSWISSSGKYINKFESDFSNYCDCSYGVSVSNGTTALHLALITLGIKSGDEVIVPDLTFAATINAVLHANATPVVVDIEEDSWCINPNEIEKAITSNTKAIVPVHLYGQPCDMDSIISIAKKYNLKVIEDCAEAHGSTYKGRKVGSFGDIGCFSFYGNKVITTGEGGMCTTNSSRYNSVMRVLRDHGMSKSKKYWHDHVGYNYRMTNLQAAIGLAQLERIDEIHKNRFACEKLYWNLLKNNGFDFQKTIPGRGKITWLVSVTVESNRDQVLKLLKKLGVDARPFFFSLSTMNIYKKYAFNENTISKKISKSGLNLPTYGDLNNLSKMDKILEEFLLEAPDLSS